MAVDTSPTHPARARASLAWWRPPAVVFAAAVAAVGLVLVVGGVTGLVWRSSADSAGWIDLGTTRWSSPGRAVTTDDLMGSGRRHLMTGMLGRASVQVTVSSAAGGDVFVGIASTRTVAGYLAGPVVAPPGTRPWWAARSSGPGPRQIDWAPRAGDWTLVVMNADATPGVGADVAFRADAGHLPWIALTSLLTGTVVVALGLTAAIGWRRGERPGAEVPAP